VGPRTGVDDVEKRNFLTLSGLELRPLGRPARSQSLYRLSYPGSGTTHNLAKRLRNIKSCLNIIKPMTSTCNILMPETYAADQ
jgi:hypothetical protein